MEDERQVLAYSRADFSGSNQLFLEFVLNDHNKQAEMVLDLGCGPGDITIALAKEIDAHILAVDGSAPMIKLAKHQIPEHHLQDRIEVKVSKLPNLKIPTKVYDLILSKDMLHHIPDPLDFWQELERLSNKDTVIYVMDLIRPNSEHEARQMMDAVVPNEEDVLKKDFYNSLLAAFTFEEVEQQLKNTSFHFQIDLLGDRHFIAKCWHSES
jgi:ubiquinone/menaquinone biosynthesis C-methylase UbiE